METQKTGSLKTVIESVTRQLVSAIEGEATERARAALLNALGQPPKRKPGRPRKDAAAFTSALVPTPGDHNLTKAGKVRQRPIQLCPVPGCLNTAVPVYGMVCKEHLDVPKSKIKEYRNARKAAKALEVARGLANHTST